MRYASSCDYVTKVWSTIFRSDIQSTSSEVMNHGFTIIFRNQLTKVTRTGGFQKLLLLLTNSLPSFQLISLWSTRTVASRKCKYRYCRCNTEVLKCIWGAVAIDRDFVPMILFVLLLLIYHFSHSHYVVCNICILYADYFLIPTFSSQFFLLYLFQNSNSVICMLWTVENPVAFQSWRKNINFFKNMEEFRNYKEVMARTDKETDEDIHFFLQIMNGLDVLYMKV